MGTEFQNWIAGMGVSLYADQVVAERTETVGTEFQNWIAGMLVMVLLVFAAGSPSSC